MVDGVGQHGDGLRVQRTQEPRRRNAGAKGARGTAFDDVLQKTMHPGVRLSAHAESRLRSSRIELSADDMKRLDGAVEKAAAKGARESLILMDSLALVVSVRNRTVITAVTPDRIKESVFTNIDSAVIT